MQFTASVPSFSGVNHAQPQFGQAYAQSHQFQFHQQEQQYNDSVGCDMDMDDGEMQMDQMAQMAGSAAAHTWNQAPSMSHHCSNSSSATSTSPGTPVDDYEEDDDIWGDNTYARPVPYSCYPSPEQHQSTFTNTNGVTQHFASAPSGGNEGAAFANYALAHGFQKSPTDCSMEQKTMYGWDNPRQAFGAQSHLV